MRTRGLLISFLLSVLACEPAVPAPPLQPQQPVTPASVSPAPSAPSAAAPPASDPVSVLTPPERFDLEAIDAYLTKAVAAKGSPGISVAIAHEGKVVFARGYGRAVIDPPLAVSPDTQFAVGSVTKQFTCASVALLAEDKKLSIDDKVSKYFPAVTRAKDISLTDLGNHVAGYRDYYPLDFVDARMRKPIEPDALVGQYAGLPLDFEPSSRFSYSNTGYIMLGRVVEKASGQTFGDFLQKRLFGPAGLTRTSLSAKDTNDVLNGGAQVARGYDAFALGEPQPAEREAEGWLHAAGGIYSTARDLATWDLALLTGKLLKPSSWKWMTSPRTLLDGRVSQYGCGLGLATRSGEAVIQHSGAVSGFLAYNTMLPRTSSAVVLLTNRMDVSSRPLHDELVSLLLKKVVPAAALSVPGPAPKEIATTLMTQFRSGTLDRSLLGADFDQYLTEARMRGVAERLSALGELKSVEVDNSAERGGMELASVRFTFANGKLRVILFRTTDGKVQQFLISQI